MSGASAIALLKYHCLILRHFLIRRAQFFLFFLQFPISSNLVSKLAVFETKGSLIHRLVSNSPLFETKDMLARWRERARGQAWTRSPSSRLQMTGKLKKSGFAALPPCGSVPLQVTGKWDPTIFVRSRKWFTYHWQLLQILQRFPPFCKGWQYGNTFILIGGQRHFWDAAIG